MIHTLKTNKLISLCGVDIVVFVGSLSITTSIKERPTSVNHSSGQIIVVLVVSCGSIFMLYHSDNRALFNFVMVILSFALDFQLI